MDDNEERGMRVVALADPADAGRVRALADQAGWPRIGEHPRGFYRPRRQTWRTEGDGELHYYENHMSGCGMVLAGAADPATAEEVIGRVSAAIPVRTEGDLLDRAIAAEAAEDIIPVVLTLGVLRTRFVNDAAWRGADAGHRDPRYRALVERLVTHPNRQVRRALMITVADWLAWWPELVEPFRTRQDDEVELAELVGLLVEFAERAG